MALKFEGAEMQLHLSMTLGVYILLGLPGHTVHRECMNDPCVHQNKQDYDNFQGEVPGEVPGKSPTSHLLGW